MIGQDVKYFAFTFFLIDEARRCVVKNILFICEKENIESLHIGAYCRVSTKKRRS